MNLDLFMPINKTIELLQSKTRNCATFVEQTQMKPQETIKVRLI